ncbi:hypothetical protein NS365_05455 [Aureimonas ureilytica]|uniref:Uncharacterized protein n=1 Tax=Aureimonas ureilytica TaxID=401562 RepID=A0A175RTT2_9HYPH|nr:hypothetical protein [Aureimonas ureilytica]KTR06881.1 hypothetical protein NS365_05455 [Aureimonas ureilytica]
MIAATNQIEEAARVGRKLRYPEHINVAVPEGTKARLDALLDDGEERLSLIRDALEREIRRRERLSKKISDND